MEYIETPYAEIVDWAIMELRHGEETTRHIVGRTAKHGRFGGGEDPYIGSKLTALDLEKREARNARGLLIRLDGEPLAKDEPMPEGIAYMMTSAEYAWGLNRDRVTWTRVD